MELLDPIAVEDIDGSFAPRLAEGIQHVQVGPEIVVIGGQLDNSHVLNETASLVWRCLDGEVTLNELAKELSDATGANADQILADIVGLSRQLGTLGFLEGVMPPMQLMLRARSRPDPVPVGHELGEFTLADTEGDGVPLESLRGRRSLLVNWSPGCGFCTQIAPELARLQEPLAEHGVQMVFVSSGDVERNQEALSQADLSARLLLKKPGSDPFAGFGTPSAYLLDADGKVEVPMAYGALEVPLLARQLAGLGTDGESSADQSGQPLIRYLPAPGGVCGPGGGDGSGHGTEWSGTRAYGFGEVRAGVRHNSEETAELLDRLLAGARVDDPGVPDNFSIALYPPTGAGKRELNLLVKGSQQLVRSRSALRVVRGLLNHLSAALGHRPGGTLRLNATAAIRDGQALLLPPSLAEVKELSPRLARVGIQLVDLPEVNVDTESREVVVPEPGIVYDASVLDQLDKGRRLGSELPAVLPGRYPLRAWFMVSSAERTGPLTRAHAVAYALPLLKSSGQDAEQAQDRLVQFTAEVVPDGIWFTSAQDLAKQLAEALLAG